MERDDWQLAGGLVLIGLAARYLFVSRDSAETVNGRDMTNKTLKVKLTEYHPFREGMTAAQHKMEGGRNDRMGKPLHTLEDFNAGNAPYVSVSGDDEIWPYGQRIEIADFPGVVFRVVDTGDNFRGLNKMYRVIGYEPLDICVYSASLPRLTTATIIDGDRFGKTPQGMTEVQTDLFEGQSLG